MRCALIGAEVPQHQPGMAVQAQGLLGWRWTPTAAGVRHETQLIKSHLFVISGIALPNITPLLVAATPGMTDPRAQTQPLFAAATHR
jgi:hypothetical protein